MTSADRFESDIRITIDPADLVEVKAMKLLWLILTSIIVLTGCEATGSKQTGGAVLGAAGGGLLGSQFGSGRGQLAATALGAVGGLLLGSSIGRSRDAGSSRASASAARIANSAPLPDGSGADM